MSETPDSGPRPPGAGQRSGGTTTEQGCGAKGPADRPAPSIPDHELIRRIGHGSYGEIWIARNVTGAYRAVKIIYRGNFQSIDPYEREFAGIRRFEPVSSARESQVHILHVGRNNEEEYFYYVMELADDEKTGTRIEPDFYIPKTIRSELMARGRLPLDECLEIGLLLTTALDHLHQHDLIHRDIKPANIIFVNGRPKLADIGLVAATGEGVSYVGTEGYLPPEGPGSKQGDIYSLGKVLYEISTGKDRMEFPELPTRLDEFSEEDRLFELNEVLVKACHQDIRRRYGSALEMGADLDLVRRGRSVAKKNLLRRTCQVVVRCAAALLGLSLIAAAGYFLRPARSKKVIPQTRRIRLDRASFNNNSIQPRTFDFSPDGHRIAYLSENTLHVWDRATAASRRIDLPWPEAWTLQFPRWSPDGNVIALGVREDIQTGAQTFTYLQQYFLVDPKACVLDPAGPVRRRAAPRWDLCWTAEGDGLTCYESDGAIHTVDRRGEELRRIDFQGVTICSLGGYSPDGHWLLIEALPEDSLDRNDRDIWALPAEGGRPTRCTQTRGLDAYPAWDVDGRNVFYVSTDYPGSDASWNIWKIGFNPQTGAVGGVPERITFEQEHKHQWPRVVDQGRRLAFVTQQRENTIWVAPEGEPGERIEVARGRYPVLSPDGSEVFFAGVTEDKVGIWACGIADRHVRQVVALAPFGTILLGGLFDLAPDGATLAFISQDRTDTGIFVVSAKGGKAHLLHRLNHSPSPTPRWSPDGQWLLFVEDGKLCVLPAEGGRPRELARMHDWSAPTWSPDGAYVAAIACVHPEDSSGNNGVFVISFPEGRIKRLKELSHFANRTYV